VRHELLPYLERHFSPSVRSALGRVATLARSDEILLAREAASVAAQVLRVTSESARIDGAELRRLPEAIARRVVLYALSSIRPQTAGALQHVEAVLDVVHERRTCADIQGLRVEHSRGSVVLVREDLARASAAPFRAELPIPGEVQIAEIGVTVHAEGPFVLEPGTWNLNPGAWGLGPGAWSGPDEARVAADELGKALVVRNRQPGDRLRPLGLGGRKKLQDLLVDRKVSRRERDRVPIVTDARGRIVWVAGHVIGEEFRVTEHTNAVIILKLRRISGVGIRLSIAPDR
jgi:tRNA(Ile)-lysidine synthase